MASLWFAAVIPVAAAINVGLSGSGIWTFDSAPAAAEWAASQIVGSSSTINNFTAMDTAVQNLNAATILSKLSTTQTVPPSISALPRWNATLAFLQTRPSGTAAAVLKATLQNNTGQNLSSLTVAYDLLAGLPSGSEDLPGYQVYYSLTGAPNSWQIIPSLLTDATGRLSATLTLGSWAPGQSLYLVWVDDTGPGTDGYYAIDNFVAFSSEVQGLELTSPAPEQVLSARLPLILQAAVNLPGTVTNVAFWNGTNLLGKAASPFRLSLTNVAPGAYHVAAIAQDQLGNVRTSAPVAFTVVSNFLPQLTLLTPPDASVVGVGANVLLGASATDGDGAISRLDFSADGHLLLSRTVMPAYLYWCDIPAGNHVITVTAVDNAGGQTVANLSLTATNPSDTTVLMPNGAIWKYLDDGTDQGTAWREPVFDDRGWSNGVAELGYGDTDRPEVTVVRGGSSATNVYRTLYFRHIFQVEKPSAFTNLLLLLLRDDAGVVYLNGVEVFRSNLPDGTINFATEPLQPATYGEGATFFSTNVHPGVLRAGTNVMAVEIHQYGLWPGALSFDAMLWGLPQTTRLVLTRTSPAKLDLAWPYPSSGFVLQSNTNLAADAWTTFSATDLPANGVHHITIDTAGPALYFRLIKP